MGILFIMLCRTFVVFYFVYFPLLSFVERFKAETNLKVLKSFPISVLKLVCFLLLKPLKKRTDHIHTTLPTQTNNVFDITKTQRLCGRAHGREVCDGPGRNWWSSWKEIGREGLWQGRFTKKLHVVHSVTKWNSIMMGFVFHFRFLLIGICCTRTVSGTKERWGVVSGMVEGYMWCKYQTARRLLQLSARVVWLLPVVGWFCVIVFSFCSFFSLVCRKHLPHFINLSVWTLFGSTNTKI